MYLTAYQENIGSDSDMCLEMMHDARTTRTSDDHPTYVVMPALPSGFTVETLRTHQASGATGVVEELEFYWVSESIYRSSGSGSEYRGSGTR